MSSRRSTRVATQPKLDYSYQNYCETIEKAAEEKSSRKRTVIKIESDDDSEEIKPLRKRRKPTRVLDDTSEVEDEAYVDDESCDDPSSSDEDLPIAGPSGRASSATRYMLKLERVHKKPAALPKEASRSGNSAFAIDKTARAAPNNIGPIDGVLVISRKSSVSIKPGIVSELHERNNNIYAGFVESLHGKVHVCSLNRPCQLEFSSHFIHGLSSNTNMMTTTQRDVVQIRKTLDGFVTPHSQTSASLNGAAAMKTVFLLWCGIDGFTTNLEGFVSLCQKYQDLGVKIYVMMFRIDLSSDPWPLYDTSAIQATFQMCKDAISTNQPIRHRTAEIEWVMGALNTSALKETTAMAARERKAQMPHSRNNSALTFESLDLPVAIREYAADAVADRVRGKTKGITPFYSLVKDERSGGYICPLAGCGKIMAMFNGLVGHLYDHSDELSCPLCDEISAPPSRLVHFDKATPNTATINHIESHLTPQNFCQVEGCKKKSKAYTTKNLAEHFKAAHGKGRTEARLYPCSVDDCDYRALNEEELAGHLLAQHGIGEGRTKRYLCEYGCGAEFLYRPQRQRHQNEGGCPMRQNIVVHECPVCHKTFYNYDAKYHHIRTLHGRRDEIADILKKAAGVDLPEVYFRSGIETNLLGEDL